MKAAQTDPKAPKPKEKPAEKDKEEQEVDEAGGSHFPPAIHRLGTPPSRIDCVTERAIECVKLDVKSLARSAGA